MGLNIGKIGASLIPGVGAVIAGADQKEAAKEQKKGAQEGARFKFKQTMEQARFENRTTQERINLEQAAGTEAALLGQALTSDQANLQQTQTIQSANVREATEIETAALQRRQTKEDIAQSAAALDARIDGERSMSAIRQTDMARKATFGTASLRARAIGSGVVYSGTARAFVDQSATLAELERLNADYESRLGVRGMLFDRTNMMLKSRQADEVADFAIGQAGRLGELTRQQAGAQGDLARLATAREAEFTVRQSAAAAALTREQSADSLELTTKFARESKTLELKYAQIGYRTERNRIDNQTAINAAADIIGAGTAGLVNYHQATGRPVFG